MMMVSLCLLLLLLAITILSFVKLVLVVAPPPPPPATTATTARSSRSTLLRSQQYHHYHSPQQQMKDVDGSSSLTEQQHYGLPQQPILVLDENHHYYHHDDDDENGIIDDTHTWLYYNDDDDNNNNNTTTQDDENNEDEEEMSSTASSTNSSEQGSVSRELIMAGSDASPGDYPYFVQWLPVNCGGVLIAPDLVLTSSTCKTWQNQLTNDGLGYVVVGGVEYGDTSSGGSKVKVIDSISHPNYKNSVHNDFMILKLQHSLEGTTVIRLNFYDDIPYKKQDNLQILGFGKKRNNVIYYSPTLQTAQVEYITNWECNQSDKYDGSVTSNMICAVGSEKNGRIWKQNNELEVSGICDGDTGGPLIQKSKQTNQHVVLGIASGNYFTCSSNHYPGIFNRVSKVTNWIQTAGCALSSSNPRFCNVRRATSNPTISQQPSYLPTIQPSTIPSTSPTSYPTSEPSTSPTISIPPTSSSSPTTSPSVSIQPSSSTVPSHLPTVEPTSKPKPEVCLYQHSNYNGQEHCYMSNQPNFEELGILDEISSLRVIGEDTSVELYQYSNYRGFSKIYTEDTWYLGSYNDLFASMKIIIPAVPTPPTPITCPSGYQDNGNSICEDIDECTTSLINPCNEFQIDGSAICENSIGSFTCRCNDGYEPLGKSLGLTTLHCSTTTTTTSSDFEDCNIDGLSLLEICNSDEDDENNDEDNDESSSSSTNSDQKNYPIAVCEYNIGLYAKYCYCTNGIIDGVEGGLLGNINNNNAICVDISSIND